MYHLWTSWPMRRGRCHYQRTLYRLLLLSTIHYSGQFKADSHTHVQLSQIMDYVMLIITSGSQGRMQVGLDRRRHKVGIHTYSDVL